MTNSLGVFLLIGAMGLAGCATPKGYDNAFSDKSALNGNAHSFSAAPEQTFRAATGTLVQRGFTIEQTDGAMGLIRATRNLQDQKDKKLSYNIIATAYVTSAPAGRGSVVTVSASQQTVLHRQTHHWTGIIGPIAIPTSKEYQTVVTAEGSIGDAGFYKDFFAAMEQNLLTSSDAATIQATATPIPARDDAVGAAIASSPDTAPSTNLPSVSTENSPSDSTDKPQAAIPAMTSRRQRLL
jgi:hypothetical protein